MFAMRKKYAIDLQNSIGTSKGDRDSSIVEDRYNSLAIILVPSIAKKNVIFSSNL